MGLVGVLEPLEPLKVPCSSRWVKMASGCYFDFRIFWVFCVFHLIGNVARFIHLGFNLS